MLIGIDASRLSEHERTGTENYLYNVVRQLALIDHENDYILYLRSDLSTQFKKDLVSNNPYFTFRLLKTYASWTQISLALACIRDSIDVLFCSWQTMPVIRSPFMEIVSVIHGFEYKVGRGGPTYFSILFSNKVIAVSDFTKREILRRMPFCKNKLEVIYEGVDTARFYKRTVDEVSIVKKKYGIVGRYILFVGSISPRKNLQNTLRAFARLCEDKTYSKDISFIISGKVLNEYKSELNVIQSLLKDLHLENRVKLLGFVPEADLPALMSGSLFLSFVSLSEGFGLPILEGLACHCRILTSNISAMSEIKGPLVHYADPRSIANISDEMHNIIQDAENVPESNAVVLVNDYNWNLCAQKILTLLKTV